MHVHKSFSHQRLKQLSVELIFCLSAALRINNSLQQDMFSRKLFVLLGLDYVIIVFFKIERFLLATEDFLFRVLCLLEIYLCDEMHTHSGVVPVCLGGLFWQQ